MDVKNICTEVKCFFEYEAVKINDLKKAVKSLRKNYNVLCYYDRGTVYLKPDHVNATLRVSWYHVYGSDPKPVPNREMAEIDILETLKPFIQKARFRWENKRDIIL